MPGSRGFTRAELAITVAITAVFATVAAANLRNSRIDANEASAVATLQQIAAAEARFKAAAACDLDGDGVGEYGLLRELSGAVGVRTTLDAATQGAILNPPRLPGALRTVNWWGDVSRSGYLFHLFLPGFGGWGVAETSGTNSLAYVVDFDLAETTWCCYAWPQRYGVTGRRTFFTNQAGDITATATRPYSGTGVFVSSNSGNAFGSRFAYEGTITGAVAVGTVGRDGLFWHKVTVRPDALVQRVRGPLADDGSRARTTFEIASSRLPTAFDETILVRIRRPLAPSIAFRLFLTDATGARTVEFGTTAAHANGDRLYSLPRVGKGLVFGFLSRFLSYPDGVSSVTEFGGGTIEVRLDGGPVLRGSIPQFVLPDGPNVPGSSASYRAVVALAPPGADTADLGSIDAQIRNDPGGTSEQLTIDALGLDPADGPFTVVAVGGDVGSKVLGTLSPGRPRGHLGLVFDTRRGDVLPAGGVLGLAGSTLEIRDVGGTVLAGTLPAYTGE